MAIDYRRGSASEDRIFTHLSHCDLSFVPRLGSRVEIGDYARKIADRAERFEAWADGELVGLVAAYCNAPDTGTAFITSVSVMPEWQGRGIASRLMANCTAHARKLGFASISLEVDENNAVAIALYTKRGFAIMEKLHSMHKMTADLSDGAYR